MRHFNIFAAVAASLMAASSASADSADSAASAASGKEKAQPPKEKKICKYEADSTSRLAKRICRTRQQWQNETDGGRDAGRTITGSGRTN